MPTHTAGSLTGSCLYCKAPSTLTKQVAVCKYLPIWLIIGGVGWLPLSHVARLQVLLLSSSSTYGGAVGVGISGTVPVRSLHVVELLTIGLGLLQ